MLSWVLPARNLPTLVAQRITRRSCSRSLCLPDRIASSRRQTVEHPFGTIKSWMGSTHFLTRTLPRVRTEMSLQVLAYNLQRAIKILSAATLISEMRA